MKLSNKWFKFYGVEFLSDPKVVALSASERSCLITLFCLASSNDDESIRFITEDMLMSMSGISPMHEEWDDTKGVLKKFESLDIILLSSVNDNANDNGATLSHDNGAKLSIIQKDNTMITLKNWRKRQGMILTPYERVKKYREKHKEIKENTHNIYVNDNADNENDNRMITLDKIREDKSITPSPSASGAPNPVYGENPNPPITASPPSQDTELSFESDEDVTPTKQVKKREAKKDGYKGDLVKPLRRWAEEKMGKKYPNIGKQEKFIGQMLYAGYTEGAIKETFENLLDDAFWGERGFDFAQVANEISKAKKEAVIPWHQRPSK